MKVLVCGGRDYEDYEVVNKALSELNIVYAFTHVIHGGQRGADRLAHRWALRNGVQPVQCDANWNYYQNKGGPYRNTAMLALSPGLVVAFPGNTGTANMIQQALDDVIKVLAWNPVTNSLRELT